MISEAELAAALAQAGLPLLTATRAADPEAIPQGASRLVEGLVLASDALFRTSLVPLFLCHVPAAACAPEVARRLEPEPRRELAHLYTAAVCMRSCWRTRLGLLGAPLPELPDLFSSELALPSPDDDYGLASLREIDRRFAAGEAGRRVRGALTLMENAVRQMFELLERKPARAPAR